MSELINVFLALVFGIGALVVVFGAGLLLALITAFTEDPRDMR